MLKTNKPHNKCYVYTLLSLKKYSFYTGFTTDLKRRITEHIRGLIDSTEIKPPFRLIHYECFLDLEDAKAREKFLKSNVGKAQLKNSLKHTLKSHRNYPYKLF